MQTKIIGRTEERRILEKALLSNEAEMIAVVGRRRVGKTFLVRSVYEKQIRFDMTGIRDATKEEQLQNFSNRLTTFSKSTVPVLAPTSWLQAFQMLLTYLENQLGEDKIVVFLDELPWMATKRSGFIKALGFFWNSWAVQKNVVVVICGSAASWMIQNVVRDRGGLHNRITRRIYLEAFNLAETEAYLLSKNVRMERYQILQIYMAMGGIPHYLKEVENGKSAIQNIDRICFSKNGILRDEFELLYPALFHNYEQHLEVIRALAAKRKGMTRKQIVESTKLLDNGGTSRILDELSSSGFITAYYAFGKKKRDMLYRLTDEYSYFYLKFIETQRNGGAGTWQRLSQTQTWKSWSGYAYENIALKHISQLERALGINGVYTEFSAYAQSGKDGLAGVQIDLLIDRNDHNINLFEIKYYKENFILNKKYADELRQKIALFKHYTKTNKQIFLTLLTTFPVLQNQHSTAIVDQALTMDVLFKREN